MKEESNIRKFYEICTRREYLGYALGAATVIILWTITGAQEWMKAIVTLVTVLIGLPAIRKYGN